MTNAFLPGHEPIPGYRLVRPRGRWEGAERWEANDPDHRRVVLRFVPLKRPLNDAERQGLDALRRVQHPNVLPLLEVVEVSGLLALIGPSFEMTLAERLIDCRAAGYAGLPRAEMARSIQEVARGLDDLNRPRPLPAIFDGEPIRHGDVRPENLVIQDGQVKLIDAGLATVLADAAEPPAVGPSPFLAPETGLLGDVNDSSDQYGLAATFVALRLGRPPVAAGSEDGEPSAPDLDGLTLAERPIVERALAKRPGKRWPSASAFADAWAEAARPAPPAPAAEEPAAETRGPLLTLPGASAAPATATLPATARPKVASRPAVATAAVPVARPAPPRPKIKAEEDVEEAEELLTPSSIQGWAGSLLFHAVLLLILAFWFWAPQIRKVAQFDGRLAGSPFGDDSGTELKGGLGMDTPLAMPESPEPALAEVPTTPMITTPTLMDIKPDIQVARPETPAGSASNGGGVNLRNPGQAGSGDGFGVAKFGQGGENINGVEVKVGDPQFTLIWDSRADLDLHVQEPGGSHLYWENRIGELGGELDVDDVDGFGPENINWGDQGMGPPGEYKWYVHYYGGLGGIGTPTRWKVRVKHSGKTTVYEGRLTFVGQKSQIYTLKVAGPGREEKEAAKK